MGRMVDTVGSGAANHRTYGMVCRVGFGAVDYRLQAMFHKDDCLCLDCEIDLTMAKLGFVSENLGPSAMALPVVVSMMVKVDPVLENSSIDRRSVVVRFVLKGRTSYQTMVRVQLV